MLVLAATVGRKSIPIPLLGSAENQNIALFPSSGKVFMASELLSPSAAS
jgi:hypothetical protein